MFMKRLRPDFYAHSIFEIDIDFYVRNNIKYVLTDLDNTLDAYDELVPSKRVVSLKNNFDNAGIELIIVSNNKAKRKEIYCNRLGIKGFFSCRKPWTKKILNYLDMLNIKKEDCILIGDQILTDVGCGKGAGIKVCLTEPITKKDQWTTKFNRLIDKPIRKHLHNIGYLEEKRIDGK